MHSRIIFFSLIASVSSFSFIFSRAKFSAPNGRAFPLNQGYEQQIVSLSDLHVPQLSSSSISTLRVEA